jgi:hypothetical protein
LFIEVNKIPPEGLEIDRVLHLQPVQLGSGEQAKVGDARLSGILRRTGSDLEFRGRVEAGVSLSCSRCLEPFTSPVDSSFDLRYQPHARNTGEGEREIRDGSGAGGRGGAALPAATGVDVRVDRLAGTGGEGTRREDVDACSGEAGDQDLVTVAAEEEVEYKTIPQMEKAISKIKKEMEKAARDLDFMEAARLRDNMFMLQKKLSEMKN